MALISEDTFNQIKKYRQLNITMTFQAISRFCNVRFAYLFIKVCNFNFYPGFEFYMQGEVLKSRADKIEAIYIQLNKDLQNAIMSKYLCNSDNDRASEDRKYIKAVISILKRVDRSEKIIKIEIAGLHGKHSVTTNEYKEILENFVNIIEDDCVKGFERVLNELKTLSYNYDGVIPDDFMGKTRILALFMACKYYSESIKQFKFYKLIDIKSWNPINLAFLLRLQLLHDEVESLFLLCTSRSIITTPTLLFILRMRFGKYLTGSCIYSKPLLVLPPEIILNSYEDWVFKIYAKFLAYSFEYLK
jgi:hypothetical protein